jgi:predicted methyltransferase
MGIRSVPQAVLRAAALAAFAVSLALAPALVQAGQGGDGIGAENTGRLKAAIAGDHREAKNRARDIFRHPLETLSFFGIKPEMTVVEIYPGGGWYTEILAPYLKGRGRLYAASWDKDSKRRNIQKWLKRYHAKLAARPDVYGGVTVTELSPAKTVIAPAGSADLVLTFRNIHNWMKLGYDRTVFEAMYTALKPGGVLGVVEHRGNPEVWPDPQALSGYVNQEDAIELAKDAGFELVAMSEVNANPKDSRNHPKGVWTLPPSLRLKNKDRDKYLAIGESDRMTLKFIKPKE